MDNEQQESVLVLELPQPQFVHGFDGKLYPYVPFDPTDE